MNIIHSNENSLNFNAKIREIRRLIDELPEVMTQPDNQFELINTMIEELSTRISSLSAVTLPYFIRRRCQMVIHAVKRDFQVHRDKATKNFQVNCQNLSEIEKKILGVDLPEVKSCGSLSNSPSFVSFQMADDIINIKEYSDSHVFLEGTCKTVRFHRVYRAIIYIQGNVEHEIRLYDCEEVTLVATCQQMRLENSSSCTFYVNTLSKDGVAIIDSFDLTFGFHHAFELIPTVVDFSWPLYNKVKSPNVKYLTKEESIKSVIVSKSEIKLIE